MISMVQPLDLQTIFVNYFAGSTTLFFIIAFIFFSYMAAKFRMTGTIFLTLLMVFVIFMFGVGAVPGYIFVLAILIYGLVVWLLWSKPWKY